MDERKDLSFEIVKGFKKAYSKILKQENVILKNYDITPLQYGVLECLHIKGGMCINELIDRLISTSGTMTVVIKNLEKCGYIKRECKLDDRRACIINLTDEGQHLVKKIMPKKTAQVHDFADTLNDKEKAELLELFYKFKQRYKETEE